MTYFHEYDNTVFIDIDSTIIYWDRNPHKSSENLVDIFCDGTTSTFAYNPKILEEVIAHKHRGQGVIIWTQGGQSWAKAVVNALVLNEYVDAVIPKPRWLIDDLQPEAWMPRAKFYGLREEDNE